MFVVEFDGLDPGGLNSLEGGIVASQESKSLGQKNHEIDSISCLNKGVIDVLYHCGVCFDSSGGSASINKEKIHLLGVFEQAKTPVCFFHDFLELFQVFAFDAILL